MVRRVETYPVPQGVVEVTFMAWTRNTWQIALGQVMGPTRRGQHATIPMSGCRTSSGFALAVHWFTLSVGYTHEKIVLRKI